MGFRNSIIRVFNGSNIVVWIQNTFRIELFTFSENKNRIIKQTIYLDILFTHIMIHFERVTILPDKR